MERIPTFSPPMRTHRGHDIADFHQNDKWDSFAKAQSTNPLLYTIPLAREARPDMISYDIYENVTKWWSICALNNIIDPFNELRVGKVLKVPKIV